MWDLQKKQGSIKEDSSRSESSLHFWNLEKERSEHFKKTHLEQELHCTDLSLQVKFLAHTIQGKTRQGKDERCRSSREEEK